MYIDNYERLFRICVWSIYFINQLIELGLTDYTLEQFNEKKRFFCGRRNFNK